MANRELEKEVSDNLFAVLQSSKFPIPFSSLEKEYELIVGKTIPYQQFGYSNLSQYLKSIPNVVQISFDNFGNVECRPGYSQESAHLRRMVKMQHPSKKYKKPNFSNSQHAIHPFANSHGSKFNRSPNIRNGVKVPKPGKTQHAINNNLNGRSVKQKESTIAVEIKNISSPGHAKREDYQVLLEDFLKNHNMGTAKYRTHRAEKKGLFVGVVKIGEDLFTTYPQEFNKKEAENESARCALEDLKSRLKSNQTPEMTISPSYIIVRRIHEFIATSNTGMWSYAVAESYPKKFNEILPDDWMTTLYKNPNLFKIQKVDNTRSLIFAVVDENYQRYRKFSDSSCRSSEVDNSESSLASSKVEMEKPSTPPLTGEGLQLPDNNKWDVFVTYVDSTTDIKLRLIGDEYSTKYEHFAVKMNEYYEKISESSSGLRIEDIYVGKLLAVKAENCWHRVEVTDIHLNDIQCLFVDCGDFGKFDISSVWLLEEQFNSLPFQAIRCQLHGFELLNEYEMNENLIQIAVGNIFIAEVINRNDVISIKLFDDCDNCINDVLFQKRLENVSIPKLEKGINKVYQSNISSDGIIHFHLCSTDLNVLENALDLAGIKTKSISPSRVNLNTIYVARACESFLRIQVIAFNETKTLVTVKYVDYGHSGEISICDILEIDEKYAYLIKVPFQALACDLRGLPPVNHEWSPEAIDRLQKLIPIDDALIARLVESSSSECFTVDLFKRIQPSNELISINQTLEFDDLFKVKAVLVDSPSLSNHSNENAHHQRKYLPILKLPEVGSYSDIHITLAASPFNFMFQLWDGGEKFDRLMLDMNHFYNKENNSIIVESSTIQNNEYYVAKYENVWYRVKAHFSDGMLASGMAMILFIDYGNHLEVPVESLLHLEAQFRNLAPQVIRGCLSGIKPTHQDWQAEDCVRFRDLVETKQFVALILGESSSEEEKILHVELINTSGAEDIYIHQLLVDENRALKL